MYKTEQFMQAAILILALTFLSIFSASFPYVCILTAGLLLVLLAVRTLSHRESKHFFICQTILSMIFAALSGNAFSYLIFYELRLKKPVPVLLPAVMFFVSNILLRLDDLPSILCSSLFLLCISGLFCVGEHFIIHYLLIKKQLTHTIRTTALRELYEKKLNQELTIKNYLAEKSARLEERENISRNIHNSVGHSITAAIVTLDAADLLLDTAPVQAREKIKVANERIRSGLQSIRHAVRVLDKENSFVCIEDLICELTAAAERFMLDTDTQVHILSPNINGTAKLPYRYMIFLTEAMQELFTNGLRHGNADSFIVYLNGDSGHIKLRVTDNGTSDFSATNQQERIDKGFGLKKLISYTKHCGGLATFKNETGFQAEITLPLFKEEREEQY